MRRFFIKLFTASVFSLFFWINAAFSQETDKDYFPTPNTVTGAKPDPKKQKEKEKRIRYVVKNDTKETLAGNLCFEEATRDMGFQYLAVPKGQPFNKNGFSKWWHNFGVKSMMVLKNGPFWKMKVNKKYEDCKYGSGDFVG